MADLPSHGISFFEAPISNTTPLKTENLKTIYNYITTNERARQATEAYRSTGEGSVKTTRFDFVTFSGAFSQRKADALVQAAPYVCLDLDDIEEPAEVLRTLTSDERYAPTLGFVSPSGQGLKVVYTVDLSRGDHKTYYQTLSGHLQQTYGVQADAAPSSVASACFLPHDPDAYYNRACPVVGLPKPQPKATDRQVTSSSPEGGINFQRVQQRARQQHLQGDRHLAQACVEHLEAEGINLAEDYTDWIQMGLALASLGEAGRELFHRVSAQSGKYAHGECEARFEQLLQDARGEVTLGTFLEACRQQGVPLKQLRAELRIAKPELPPATAEEKAAYDFGAREAYEVRLGDELAEEIVCLGMYDSGLALFGRPAEPRKIATLGNFSIWLGKAKSRKTFLVSLFVAAALCGEGRFQRRIHAALPKDKRRVLLFDTEQGTNDVLRVQRRIAALAGKEDDPGFLASRMKTFALRALTPAERLDTIEEQLAKHRGYGLVVIDGIRDLVSSINDEEQATLIASRLLRWTQDYGVHLMGVLHMNKGVRNARGHLGTEVVNKAESVIAVTKDDAATSSVAPEYMRGREFLPFSFSIGEDGLPNIGAAVPKKQSGKAKFTPANIQVAVHQGFLKQTFKGRDALTHTELWKAVHGELGERYDFGQSKAKEFPGWYVLKRMLRLQKKGNSKLYSLPDSD